MIIALIGMTGVGKTTVGKILATQLKYKFADTDELILEASQKTPAEIFAESGEEIFRDVESEVLDNIFLDNADDKNIVISCGGGIILREKNRDLLRQSSNVIWLVRPLKQISAEIINRPPIYNKLENYAQIFKARENLYAQTCHFKISFTDPHEAAAQIIIQTKK